MIRKFPVTLAEIRGDRKEEITILLAIGVKIKPYYA
jgi:hypothetical protein